MPELLLAMLILTFIIAGSYTLLVFGQTNWNISTERAYSRSDISRALSIISSNLREAVDIQKNGELLELANKNETIFYANLDEDEAPEKVHFYIKGGNLIKSVTQASNNQEPYNYSNQSTDQTIAKNILNDNSIPLFRFYDNNNNELTALPLSKPDIKKTTRIFISLTTKTNNTKNQEDVFFSTSINFRNKR